MIAPVLKSPGSKWRVADRIVAMLPRHRVYLEPYFGSGAVLFNKPPSHVETINDRDGEVANLFRVLRDPESRSHLSEAVELTPWAEEELWLACEPAEDLDEVERARRLVVHSWQNVGSRQVGKAHFGYARACSGGSSGKTWDTLPDRIRAAGERLRCVQVLCRDACEVIRDHADEDVLVYADPPYPSSTRPGAGRLYTCEMDDDQHEELLAALGRHPGPVVLSGYRCTSYDEALAAWMRVQLRGYAQSHGRREEVLYLNPKAARGRPNTLF